MSCELGMLVLVHFGVFLVFLVFFLFLVSFGFMVFLVSFGFVWLVDVVFLASIPFQPRVVDKKLAS